MYLYCKEAILKKKSFEAVNNFCLNTELSVGHSLSLSEETIERKIYFRKVFIEKKNKKNPGFDAEVE